jgi:hypothetical protein
MAICAPPAASTSCFSLAFFAGTYSSFIDCIYFFRLSLFFSYTDLTTPCWYFGLWLFFQA